MKIKQVKTGKVQFGGSKLVLIAGPCVIESEAHALRHAEKIGKIAKKLGISYVFKASFDKANRSSSKSFRGPGLEKGLEILRRIGEKTGHALLSDIHETSQVKPAAEVLDILQIPAFLCRQSDLLSAAAKTGKIVNVKKGQFLAPWDMKNVVNKLEESGCRKILLTERGASFGYNTLVSDFRAIPLMRNLGYPVVFDATHSVQKPGGLGTASGGESEFIPLLASCGVVAGADAIFLEVHENPSKALSDGPNNLALKDLEALLKRLLRLRKAI